MMSMSGQDWESRGSGDNSLNGTFFEARAPLHPAPWSNFRDTRDSKPQSKSPTGCRGKTFSYYIQYFNWRPSGRDILFHGCLNFLK